MEEKDLKQYNEIKQILEYLQSKDLNEIKIVFNSSKLDDKAVFASYQFPINLYNEQLYNDLKEYAQLDYEITKRNYMDVEKNTKFNFVETNTNLTLANYNYEHSLEFLESMQNNIKK